MVYVDTLTSCIPNKNWKWNKSCHLYADSIEELHQFALKIGMKRSWFQNDSRLPHYDLNENRRKIAVQRGAIEVGHRFTYWFMKLRAWEKVTKNVNSEVGRVVHGSEI